MASEQPKPPYGRIYDHAHAISIRPIQEIQRRRGFAPDVELELSEIQLLCSVHVRKITERA
jgi:hypothetical protein